MKYVTSLSFLFNPLDPGTMLLCPIHGLIMLAFLCKNLDYKPQSINQPYTGQTEICLQKIKSKFIHINIYLNVKCILTFFKLLTLKITLLHKKNHSCNIHTLGDTGKFWVHVTPLSPTSYKIVLRMERLPPGGFLFIHEI